MLKPISYPSIIIGLPLDPKFEEHLILMKLSSYVKIYPKEIDFPSFIKSDIFR